MLIKIEKYKNYRFVWITDGQGWKSSKNKLEEAYNHIQHIYNFHNLNNFIKLLNV